jgi:hypothetical protein
VRRSVFVREYDRLNSDNVKLAKLIAEAIGLVEENGHLPPIQQQDLGSILGWCGAENALDAARRVVGERDEARERVSELEERLSKTAKAEARVAELEKRLADLECDYTTVSGYAQRRKLRATEVLMKLLERGDTGAHMNKPLTNDQVRFLDESFADAFAVEARAERDAHKARADAAEAELDKATSSVTELEHTVDTLMSAGLAECEALRTRIDDSSSIFDAICREAGVKFVTAAELSAMITLPPRTRPLSEKQKSAIDKSIARIVAGGIKCRALESVAVHFEVAKDLAPGIGKHVAAIIRSLATEVP